MLGAGIVIHKTAAVVAMGGTLAAEGYKFKAIVITLAIFSLMAPIGIVIGLLAQKSNTFVDIVFLSLSGGTFIYIACSEIIATEFKAQGPMPTSHRWLKFAAIMGGILTICGLWFMEGEGHNHGGHSDFETEAEHAAHSEEKPKFTPRIKNWLNKL